MRLRLIAVIAPLLIAGALGPAAAVRATDVVVDGSKRHQTVEGFGACLIAWMDRFRELYRTEEFQRIYVEGVGCTMLRVNMWGPTLRKPVDDWTKIRGEDFDMGADGGRAQIFVDFGRGIRKINPQIKIIGTVWSPPAWMKVNKSITDKKSSAIRAGGYGSNTNRVDPKYFKHFCKWMVEYVKLHDKQGVPFYAVSPGNEVQFSQSFESCVWDGRDFATIVVMLREMLDAEGYRQVKVFGPETMTSHLYEGGTGSYVKALLADPKALEAIGVFATHGYEDGVKAEMSANSSRRFWDLTKDTGKPFWITEGGTGAHDWPAPIQKGIGNALHNALVAGNCSAFVPWQITERNKSIHAIMMMSTYTPKTYTAMHYTKFIRPGARRIDAEPGFDAVQAGAFLHPDRGEFTLVAINSTDREQTLNLTFRNLKGLSSLKTYRTSASESLKPAGDVTVKDDKATFQMTPQSIVTFSGKTKPDGLLFSESFEDSDLAKRGWYDGSQFRIAGGALAGKGCIEYEWADGATKVSGSSPVRHLFEPTDEVAIRFYLKLSKGWGWSGQNFHPHLTHFLTTENPKWHGPAASHLTLYIEPVGGKLRLAAQDIQNAAAPHGLTQGPLRGGYNGKLYDSKEVLYSDDQWHCVEAYFKLNTLDLANDRPNPDGIVRGWFDGRLVVDRTDVILRSTDFPKMKFNQFLMAPYFGPGLLPHAQKLWIDELAVGTRRIGPLGGKR